MSWAPLTPPQLGMMSLEDLKSYVATFVPRIQPARTRQSLILQICTRLGIAPPRLSRPPRSNPQRRSPRLAARVSEEYRAPTNATVEPSVVGPVRSNKKELAAALKKPYSREGRPLKSRNLNTRRRENHEYPETHHGTINEGTPKSSPEPEAMRATTVLATEDSVRDTVEMMADLQGKLEALEEENQEVEKSAKQLRGVAKNLKEQLTVEMERTGRLLDYLKHWQRTSQGWEFSSIFPPSGAVLRRKAGDWEEMEVDEADAKNDPMLQEFLDGEKAQRQTKGKGKQATQHVDEPEDRPQRNTTKNDMFRERVFSETVEEIRSNARSQRDKMNANINPTASGSGSGDMGIISARPLKHQSAVHNPLDSLFGPPLPQLPESASAVVPPSSSSPRPLTRQGGMVQPAPDSELTGINRIMQEADAIISSLFTRPDQFFAEAAAEARNQTERPRLRNLLINALVRAHQQREGLSAVAITNPALSTTDPRLRHP